MILVRDYMERISACVVVVVAFPIIVLMDWMLGKEPHND